MNEAPKADMRALLQRSVLTIQRLEKELAEAKRAGSSEPIAIVGIGCRFPGGADTPEKLWELLCNERDAVTEIPKHRWDIDEIYSPDADAPGKTYARWGAFLDDVEGFEPAFFGITPREAANIDPQQRMLLETTWEALEHAGIAPASLAGTQTGVYVGITGHDWSMMSAMARGERTADAYGASGGAISIASGRLSYFLGANGPNFALDTACSSSMVAVHQAVMSLRKGESDFALAGGVTLTLSPVGSILTARARMMSFTGKCHTFDASADGYVRGEGCGMIALKRLSDAERDGDRVIAVIKGSAINQDGRSTGMTAPNGPAQVAVIRAALKDAGLKPDDVSYVEAHGTGTSLGDPIEINALGDVFGERSKDAPLLVGSLKTNIGHTEGAAGIAGIIKAALAIQHRQIPAHLNLENPNPLIPWDELPIKVPQSLTPWTAPEGGKLRAGSSSFGFSGTNAHVILEEAPEPAAADPLPEHPATLLPMSGRSEKGVQAMAGRLAQYLRDHGDLTPAQVAAELSLGRSHLDKRQAVVVTDRDDAIAKLDELGRGVMPGDSARGSVPGGDAPELVMMFTGQGSQYAGMTKGLYDTEPAFREALDACAAGLDGLLAEPLLPVIFAENPEKLNDTAFSQPALFSVEYALYKLWSSWGIEPAAVLGHSVGEITAACVAGVFSLDDALRLIAARGRLMSDLPREGTMAAVFASAETVRPHLKGHEKNVSVAAMNGPENTVISGRRETVKDILGALSEAGISAQELTVSHAFHSPLMEPMLDAFEEVAASITYHEPNLALVSNLTGDFADAKITTPGYWRTHIREAVRFGDSVTMLLNSGFRSFLEVGPAATLLGMARQSPAAGRAHWVGSLRKGRDDAVSIRNAAAALYVQGHKPDWAAMLGGGKRPTSRVALPTYPFQRERFWREYNDAPLQSLKPGSHPLLGASAEGPVRIFPAAIGVPTEAWLNDHRIYDFAPFPAAGFIELAFGAARESLGTDHVSLKDIEIRDGLILPEDETVPVQVILTGASGDLKIYSAPEEDAGSTEWRFHMQATAGKARGGSGTPLPPVPGDADHLGAEEFYGWMSSLGVEYGPNFQALQSLDYTGTEAWAKLKLPEGLKGEGYLAHPSLTDACAQLLGVLLRAQEESGDAYMPVQIATCTVYGGAPAEGTCHVVQRDTGDPNRKACDFWLYDADGKLCLAAENFQFQRVSRSTLKRMVKGRSRGDWLFDLHWASAPLATDDPETAPQNWLVLADRGGVGDTLAEKLRGKGAAVTIARRGESSSKTDDGWTANGSDPAELHRLLSETGAPDAIVNLWPLDAREAENPATRDEILATGLGLSQAAADGARMWFVTRGSQSVHGEAPDLTQSPLNALAGVISSERPALSCVRVDLDPAPNVNPGDMLFRAVWTPDRETQTAFRGESRLAARLAKGKLVARAGEQPVMLDITQRGVLENLTLRPVDRRPPGPGEIELRVSATGVNFRDVLNTLGMYPGDPGPLGSECAGVVTQVGEGVTDYYVGQNVVAMTDESFATYVTVGTNLCVPKPDHLSMAEAAGTPVVFLTADYALTTLGKVKPGDRVLVHAITGGVGMAAAQLARRMGAKVYGTAGTPAKRALALSQGAEAVGDSRSLSFVDDMKAATEGEGFDFVLNSLAGDFIPASLDLLKDGGRFVEIGKTDEWGQERIDREYPGREYHQLYLGDITASDDNLIRSMLEDIYDGMEKGELAPLPHRAWSLEEAEDAFRYMAQGYHTGKVILTQTRPETVREDGTYLVTGGLRGIGLRTAQWLADAGAKNLVLVSRSGATPEAEPALQAMRDAGVTIQVAAADVADRAAMTAVVDEAAAEMPPLRGIIHAAGIIDDGMLPDQTMDRFRSVMAPKIDGAQILHDLTWKRDLDFFVVYASGAGLMGAAGQSNYAAANGWLDAFSHWRRAQGLHGLSVDWGSWAEVGMAAGVDDRHQKRWTEMGLRMIQPDDGVEMLSDAIFGSPEPQVAIVPMILSKLPADASPLFTDLAQPAGEGEEDGDAQAILDTLAAASEEERAALLTDWLADQVVRVLALDGGTPDTRERSLLDLGMDSLMAMELHNRISAAMDVVVPVSELLKGPTVEGLSTQIFESYALATEDREEEEI